MKVKEIINYLESIAPLSFQEHYDNAGLLTGSPEKHIDKVLITLDVTEEVMDEAVKGGFDMIIAHHPVIFDGLKKINGKNLVERVIIKAIKHDIILYAAHTNLDSVFNGVNAKLGEKLGLKNLKFLKTKNSGLKKLAVFCPVDHAEKVRNALFDAGAGHIGNYDSCSYNTYGEGSFRALQGANPFVGEVGAIHFEKEIKIETVVPDFILNKVLQAMLAVHPYEEVAFDIYPLENSNPSAGEGMIGELMEETYLEDYLKKIKKVLNVAALKYNAKGNKKVKKIAFCGGSGSFLIHQAAAAGADVFITADVKYHDFFEYSDQMVIVDAGHYETEQFTKELLYELLTEKFPTFAVRISKINTNPIKVL